MRLFKLCVILASCGMIGACSVCGYPPPPGYAAGGDYYAWGWNGGAEALPPAQALIDQPPVISDTGYFPAFYWNRVSDWDAPAYAEDGPAFCASTCPAR
jgi:hypothetical protein